MVKFRTAERYEYVVKVEFMSVRKFEIHRFCFFSDAVKCLKSFQGNPDVYYLELYSEIKFKRDYDPLFD